MDKPPETPATTETAPAKPKRAPRPKDPNTGKFLRRDGTAGTPKPKAAAAAAASSPAISGDGWKVALACVGILLLVMFLSRRPNPPAAKAA